MKVKGKRIISNESAADFANTVRGQYIISQALTIGAKELIKLEERNEPFPEEAQHAEPSNRKYMEYLLLAFPLYGIHENNSWEDNNINKEEI